MSFRQKKLFFSGSAVYIWVALGAIVISVMQNYPFYRSLYFLFVTIKTIGFGDYTPHTILTRSIVFVWFLVGAVVLGSYLLDLSNFYSQSIFVLNDIRTCYTYDEEYHPDDINQHINNLVRYIKENSRDYPFPEDELNISNSDTNLLSSEANDPNSELALSYTNTRLTKVLTRVNHYDTNTPSSYNGSDNENDNSDPAGNIIAQSFKHVSKAAKSKLFLSEINRFEKELLTIKLKSIYILFFSHLLYFLFSSAITFFLENDHWTFMDAFWFSFVSFSTLGYGDIVPKNKATMAFFCFFVIYGISIFSSFIVLAADLINHFTKSKINSILSPPSLR
ncbi:Potassium channel subfamily K member 18 [Smittium culicis]|uniref:Potassium channel subfamily K member 18 n=1 Tax=Smittium culicis TaxID=133412 RepID=A0A1R1XA90_9FUNG|nr:Potassium channel subfamily K member 18 [Smittium culicis]OMJ19314.1 Potassium channel subfamily K member 18 [Smittium culicis]